MHKLAIQCQDAIRLLNSDYQLRIYMGHKVDSWEPSVEFVLLRGEQIIAKCTDPEHAEGVLRMLLVELEDLIEAERREQQARYKEGISDSMRYVVEEFREFIKSTTTRS